MKHVLLIAVAVAALGSCNREPKVDAKDATPEEVAAKVRESGLDQPMIRPGLWQSKVTVEKLEMPGMPPEMAHQMRTMMAQNQAHDFESCLTAEDVKKPKEDFFAGKDNQCRYEHFTMSGGKIDAVMHCGKEAAAGTMRMAGTYSPDNYQMQLATEAAGREGSPAMQMQMRVESKRIGECSAKQG